MRLHVQDFPTIAETVLRAIERAPMGLRYREIQRVAYEAAKGLPYHPRKNRGWWGTNLRQLLPAFCIKDSRGRWRLCEPIAPPFFGRDMKTKTHEWNRARDRAEHLRRAAASVKCPSCSRPYYEADYMATPDKSACWRMRGQDTATDCRGRVWLDDELTVLDAGDLREADEAAGDRDWARRRAFVRSYLLRRITELETSGTRFGAMFNEIMFDKKKGYN